MELTQSTAVPQLYTATADGAPAGTLLYLLPQGAKPPPETIEFGDSWSAFPGAYLFLETALVAGTEAAFCASAWAYLGDRRLQGTRFAWLAAPTASALLSGTPVAVYQPAKDGPFVTAFPVTFLFRNVALTLASGTAVEPDTESSAFVFTPAAADTNRIKWEIQENWLIGRQTYERFENIVLVHGVRSVDELAYHDVLTEHLPAHEFLGDMVSSQLRYYPTVTREPYKTMGRVTELMASGKMFEDLGLPPLDAAHDRVMICGSPGMLRDLKHMLEARGFKEGNTSTPGAFVIERAFVEQ